MTRLTLFAYVLAGLVGTVADARGPGGFGTAVDGDTLVVGGERVRLFGIDAPELHQTCQRNDEDWSCGTARSCPIGADDRRTAGLL